MEQARGEVKILSKDPRPLMRARVLVYGLGGLPVYPHVNVAFFPSEVSSYEVGREPHSGRLSRTVRSGIPSIAATSRAESRRLEPPRVPFRVLSCSLPWALTSPDLVFLAGTIFRGHHLPSRPATVGSAAGRSNHTVEYHRAIADAERVVSSSRLTVSAARLRADARAGGETRQAVRRSRTVTGRASARCALAAHWVQTRARLALALALCTGGARRAASGWAGIPIIGSASSRPVLPGKQN